MSLLLIAVKGGLLMLVLLLISIIAVFIIVERLIKLKRSKTEEDKFVIEVKQFISQNQKERAMRLCELRESYPIAKITMKGLNTLDNPHSDTKEMIESAARVELKKLEKNLGTLSTFAAVAPLVGFLGTVTGMVKVFMRIESTGGGVDISLLAGGIWEAMITTIGGLVVGIFIIIFYNHLIGKVENIAMEMEERSNDILIELRKIKQDNQL